jgi:Dolichyl-phosphate-mannose-protein mannosyltransferase
MKSSVSHEGAVMASMDSNGSPDAFNVERRDWKDVAVYVFLIGLGATEVFLARRSADFAAGGDATYTELAKSILAGAGYGFNFKPETMLPPGFPYLLAWMTKVFGGSHTVLVSSMGVFTTLALIFAYEALRRVENRAVAATICLLLGSSPVFFRFSTTLLYSDMPYFFGSMLLVWAMMHLDSAAPSKRTQTSWWLLCLIVLLATVIVRSTGIALLAGIIGWQTISAVRDMTTAQRRLLVFGPLLILGMGVQMTWMHWALAHQYSEWPIHGYQENYLAQLRIKNGNDPELGMATWKDVLARPVQNADDRAAELWTLVARKPIAPAWYSPTTALPVLLVLLGLGASFWKSGGGILEWYFLSYEAMYLFWPWSFEERFLLPVAPLACLYLWRGGVLAARCASSRPRPVAAAGIAVAAVGAASALLWGAHVQHPSPRGCVAIWGLVAVSSAVLLLGSGKQDQRVSALAQKTISYRGRALPLWQVLAAAVVTVLFVLGVAMQFRIGHDNLHFRPEDTLLYPDIDAAQWLQEHTASSAVVMAREDDIVYHYGERRVIWLPPSTDAQLLMDGIRRYHVQYIVVVNGYDSYWKPTADQCFDAVSKAYPTSFQLVYQMAHEGIYQVVAGGAD